MKTKSSVLARKQATEFYRRAGVTEFVKDLAPKQPPHHLISASEEDVWWGLGRVMDTLALVLKNQGD